MDSCTINKSGDILRRYGNAVYSTTQTYGEFNSSVSLYLFATHTEIGDNLVGVEGNKRLYSCKIWDNEILIRDFIPCYRKLDNEIGLYDAVEGKFYTNQSTTGDDFSAGPEI